MIRWATALVAAALAGATAWVPPTPTGAEPAGTQSYQNPVYGAESGFADPTVIRGRDGYFYAYGTGRGIPIIRSSDLVTWEDAGQVITAGNRPPWVGPQSGNWAPDISFADGRYVLTFTIAGTPVAPTPNRAVGVATAPTPTGPWTLPDSLLLEPEMWHPTPNAPLSFRSIMDTDAFTAPDGTRYLYYGGFRGGIYVVPLSPDGTEVAGEPVKVASEHAYEAVYVVYREGWFYLMASSGGCCAGPVSGYQVLTGRSRSPLGPFADREGVPMLDRTPGGTPVMSASGNRWVGPGHHSVVTDVAGQDWFVYHAIDRGKPYQGPPPNTETVRPMMLDRLDWVDGWPVVRGGRGPSDEPVQAPATAATVADTFETGAGIGDTWRDGPGWSLQAGADGRFARSPEGAAESVLRSRRVLTGDTRVRFAVRSGAADQRTGGGAAGVGLLAPWGDSGLRVLIDQDEQSLVVENGRDGAWTTAGRGDLPDSFTYDQWHEIDLRLRDGVVHVAVNDTGQHDPVVSVRAEVDTFPAHRVHLLAHDAVVDVDDVTAARLSRPHLDVAPNPELGVLDEARSDEFDGPLGAAWSWVREPAAQVTDGRLRFPVQDADLTGSSNDASLLLRAAPEGEWTVSTSVTTDFGRPDSYPQAGLVAYVNDDHYLRLTMRGHGEPVVTALQKEMPYGQGTVANSATFGAGEPTTWLRLHHRQDPSTGEHVLRAASSHDGQTWTWSTTSTLPAGDLRIGLASHGGEPVDVAFDHFRLYRP